MSLSCFPPCAQKAPQSQSHVKPEHCRSHAPAVARDHFEDTGPSRAKVAILLNARARQVTPMLSRRLENIVGSRHAFYSYSLAEARLQISKIVAGGYDTVVCCGGDGTLITAINMARAYIAQQASPIRMPRFAQLALGTGNALRQVLGAANPTDDLQRIHRGHSVDRPLSLIEDHNGTAFFFAGVGHDALLMRDYDDMQRSVPGFVSRNMLRSKVGFAAALLSRTAPHMALHRNHGRAIVTAEGPCYRIDQEHGDTLVPLVPGEIFSGKIGTLGVSTVPWLGYDIHMFPFAGKDPNLMHLRITQLSLFGMLAHSKSMWRGTYRHPTRCHDFLVTTVHVRLDRKLHYQHSGESQGRVERLSFGIRPNAITVAAQAATQRKRQQRL